MDRASLVRDWIALGHTPQSSPEYDRLFHTDGVLWDLCQDDPDEAWEVILAVLNADTSGKIMEILSAGPLEDLLAKNGLKVIERVEAEARRNPKFAFLLGGVWQNAMSEEIWQRVLAVRDRKGWDEIPAA